MKKPKNEWNIDRVWVQETKQVNEINSKWKMKYNVRDLILSPC